MMKCLLRPDRGINREPESGNRTHWGMQILDPSYYYLNCNQLMFQYLSRTLNDDCCCNEKLSSTLMLQTLNTPLSPFPFPFWCHSCFLVA